jgi:hypothetical protein
MSRSNFDPTNPDSERTGRGGLERDLGPEAQPDADLPGEAIDGAAEEEDAPEDNDQSHEELSTDEAARRLDQMQRDKDSIENSPDTSGQVE